VKVCLVGIVTSDDDGGPRTAKNTGMSILDVLSSNRYRISTLTIQHLRKCYLRVFDRNNIIISDDAKKLLPALIAPVINTNRSTIQKVCQILIRNMQQGRKDVEISTTVLSKAFAIATSNKVLNTGLSFEVPKQTISSKDDFFKSIGGNNKAKVSLEDALSLDERKSQILSNFGLSLPAGVLLYGPPGTGKTLLAKATSQIMMQRSSVLGTRKGAFISLRASDIVCAEIGTSEKIVRATFEAAQKNSPAVIFIDEFQALFTSRDSGDGGRGKGSSRLASTLLQCMDDVTKWRNASMNVLDITSFSSQKVDHYAVEKNRVVVVGATNTPWMIDPAFLRPGRFDKVVHVGLPTLLEREAILRVHVSQMNLHCDTDVSEICQKMAIACIGFSGADLSALVRAAAIRCMNTSGSLIEMQHFIDARKFDVIQPSSDESLVNRLEHWKP